MAQGSNAKAVANAIDETISYNRVNIGWTPSSAGPVPDGDSLIPEVIESLLPFIDS